jgi:hypothetical protein
MQVLLIRRDADGSTFYQTYDNDAASAQRMAGAVMAHLNTVGVTEVTLIPCVEMGHHV